ncbi:DUF4162 domain-containing protein [Arthrobacter sp. StoSoilB5]|uniref:DUF4162 domain-containing protein n=1 Tax=Arthrobacter sp. StoSoilB5 TaxID=2830992 RepID=UPI001CC56222|nr:DUF4162 domain-containing protein [Arthrobacter sp. StoSoilB5]
MRTSTQSTAACSQFGGRVVRPKPVGSIPSSPNYQVTVRDRNCSELSISDSTDEAAVSKELVDSGVAVRSFATTKISLEDIHQGLP